MLAEKGEKRQRELRERGFLSDQQLQLAEEARLDQAAKLRALERSRIATQRERLTLEGELKDLPYKFQAQFANIERNISEVAQNLAEAEARREIVEADVVIESRKLIEWVLDPLYTLTGK